MRKFGVIEIVLAVLVAGGIVLNLFAWGVIGGGSDDEPIDSAIEATPRPTPRPRPTPEPTPEPEPEPTPTPEPTPDEDEGGSSDAAASKTENAFADFRGYEDSSDNPPIEDWLSYIYILKWDGLTAGDAMDWTAITDFNEITGYWKAYTEELESHAELGTMFTVEISGTADNAVITYHTKNSIMCEPESRDTFGDISHMDGNTYLGHFTDGKLYAVDEYEMVEIIIDAFYAYPSGMQDAAGEVIIDGGGINHDYIALQRK